MSVGSIISFVRRGVLEPFESWVIIIKKKRIPSQLRSWNNTIIVKKWIHVFCLNDWVDKVEMDKKKFMQVNVAPLCSCVIQTVLVKVVNSRGVCDFYFTFFFLKKSLFDKLLFLGNFCDFLILSKSFASIFLIQQSKSLMNWVRYCWSSKIIKSRNFENLVCEGFAKND